MNQKEAETIIEGLDDVQREENFGYIFFFVGDDHMLPFVTIAAEDNEYDKVSNLDRDGVFRINIGVGREIFESMFDSADSGPLDYSALNTFLPHPDYAKQHFICILSPAGENVELTQKHIEEAHSLAAARYKRKADQAN